MSIKFHQANSPQELVDYLNDIVLSTQLSIPVMGLHGKTLILDISTITFSDPSGAGLSPAEIVAQINNVVADAAALRNYGRAQSPSPQVQLAIVKAGTTIQPSGTANPILGFSTTTARQVGSNAVLPANIIQITSDASGSRFTAFHA